MWYHANQLYGKASLLAGAGGVSDKPEHTGPLDVLKKAIGENDSAPGSLQKALSELSSATGDSLIVEKAFNVVNAYNEVAEKYKAVKAQATQYRGALAKTSGTEYEQVTNAFNALKNKYNGAINDKDPHYCKKYFIKYPTIVTKWLNFITYFVTGGDSGPNGCPDSTNASETITSVKLTISGNSSSDITHKIILSGTGATNGTLTHNSDNTINLGSVTTGTLTISLPGGEIKFTGTINGNQLTIQNGSTVSVTKGGKKIKLQSTANLNSVGSTKTLTITSDPSGQTEATISGTTNVALNYGTGSGEITISGNAISDLRRYKPDLSPQYFDGGFKKWTEYDAGQFYLGFNILMVIKIVLGAIFIYSLHYRDGGLSRSIVNQPKMSTFLTIIFYMCHEILLALGFSGFIGNDGAGTAVTLMDSGDQFESKAAITITTKSKDVNFTTLELTSGQSLNISSIKGTIKNAGGNLRTTSPTLPKDTVLDLNASGTISGGNATGDVTLKGTIVVSSNGITLYNLQDLILLDGLPSGLKEKAKDIQNAVNQLKSAAELSATEVGSAAGNLASNAQDLNTHAEALPVGDELSELGPQAQALATLAGTKQGGGLAKKATDLSSNTGDAGKAIAVIEAFKTVKKSYEILAKQEKYQQPPESVKQKVQNVDDQYQGVNAQFEALCMALIKEFANQVATAAQQLASSGGQSEADNVINNFDVVDSAYNQLSNPDNMDKASDIAGKATTISSSAAGNLSTPATALDGAATALTSDNTVANAQKFKDEYDAFKDIKSTIEIKAATGGPNSKTYTITIKNLPHIKDTFKPRQVKFFWIIVHLYFAVRLVTINQIRIPFTK